MFRVALTGAHLHIYIVHLYVYVSDAHSSHPLSHYRLLTKGVMRALRAQSMTGIFAEIAMCRKFLLKHKTKANKLIVLLSHIWPVLFATLLCWHRYIHTYVYAFRGQYVCSLPRVKYSNFLSNAIFVYLVLKYLRSIS